MSTEPNHLDAQSAESADVRDKHAEMLYVPVSNLRPFDIGANHDENPCGTGYLDFFKTAVLGTVHIQTGVCAGCQKIIARRYSMTGPGTGPWIVLGDYFTDDTLERGKA